MDCSEFFFQGFPLILILPEPLKHILFTIVYCSQIFFFCGWWNCFLYTPACIFLFFCIPENVYLFLSYNDSVYESRIYFLSFRTADDVMISDPPTRPHKIVIPLWRNPPPPPHTPACLFLSYNDGVDECGINFGHARIILFFADCGGCDDLDFLARGSRVHFW